MLSDAFVRGIRGPVGSAKSSTAIMELFRQLTMARANDRGWRMTRVAIVRNTSPQLKTTTMKTWADWLPPDVFGEPKMAPPPFEHEIDMELGDGTRLVSEVLFVALDRPEDMKKLLSLELTWAFINEAREVNKTIVDGVTQRLRRYPSQRNGGFSRSGLIMDTNAPDSDHWWPIMAGEAPPPEGMSDDEIRSLVKPTNWEFFVQPPAMLERRDDQGVLHYDLNPEGENIQNMDPEYYPGQIAGKTKAWIDVYILNRLGAVFDGRPVQPDFNRDVHVAGEPLEPLDGVEIVIGVDFGLTPAAVFWQKARQQILGLDEIVLRDADARDLAAAIKRKMADRFPGFRYRVVGDPAGDQRAGTDKNTPFNVLRSEGIIAIPARTNDPEIRRSALSEPLRRMNKGEPGIIFDPRCAVTIAGYEGGWVYKRVGGGTEFHDEPSKNRFSHPCEAGEYGLLGLGEGILTKPGGDAPAPGSARAQTDPLARFAERRNRSGFRRR